MLCSQSADKNIESTVVGRVTVVVVGGGGVVGGDGACDGACDADAAVLGVSGVVIVGAFGAAVGVVFSFLLLKFYWFALFRYCGVSLVSVLLVFLFWGAFCGCTVFVLRC